MDLKSYPCTTKTSQETQRSLQKFLEPSRKPNVIPSNLAKPVKILPGIILRRQEQIGIAERAVRRVKEGTSAVLLQSGLDENWWADSMECYTYLRDIQDLLSDGKTSIRKTFWETI